MHTFLKCISECNSETGVWTLSLWCRSSKYNPLWHGDSSTQNRYWFILLENFKYLDLKKCCYYEQFLLVYGFTYIYIYIYIYIYHMRILIIYWFVSCLTWSGPLFVDPSSHNWAAYSCNSLSSYASHLSFSLFHLTYLQLNSSLSACGSTQSVNKTSRLGFHRVPWLVAPL